MVSGDDFGQRVASLLREGSREQYDEMQKFVLEALYRGQRIDGEIIMEVIWALLPPDAQDGIAAAQKPAVPATQ